MYFDGILKFLDPIPWFENIGSPTSKSLLDFIGLLNEVMC